MTRNKEPTVEEAKEEWADFSGELQTSTSTTRKKSTRVSLEVRLERMEQARVARENGKTKKLELLSLHGEHAIHPLQLKRFQLKGSMLKNENIPAFREACDAFVRYLMDKKCRNYQNKRYVTQCHCLKILGEGSNSDLKIDQLVNSIVKFYLRTRDC